MILYTPISQEEVFNNQENHMERTYITHEGKMFYVDKFPNGEHKLAQLLSTNPNDYLNEGYNPGSPIH